MSSRNEGVVIVTKINAKRYLVECCMCGWRRELESEHTAAWLAFTHNRNFRKEGCNEQVKQEWSLNDRKCVIMDEITEADEAATDKATALSNLRAQVSQGETPAIIDMYERAAWGAGASVAETEEAIKKGRVK